MKFLLFLTHITACFSLQAQIQSHTVSPYDTDFKNELTEKNHITYCASNKKYSNTLLILLPDSNVKPNQYQNFLQHSTTLGNHGIILSYPNNSSLLTKVKSNEDLSLYRQAVFNAEGGDSIFNIAPHHAIKARIESLLIYMAMMYPNEGWNMFLKQKNVDWQKIILVGHGNGACNALFFSKEIKVKRLLLFSGIDVAEKRLANWQTIPGKTKAEDIYAFVHSQNTNFLSNEKSLQFQLWQKLGLDTLGALHNVDTCNVNKQSSHILSSSLPVKNIGNSANNYHNALIVDNYIPTLANGKIAYSRVYDYLLSDNKPTTTLAEPKKQAQFVLDFSVRNGKVRFGQMLDRIELINNKGEVKRACNFCASIDLELEKNLVLKARKDDGVFIHSFEDQ